MRRNVFHLSKNNHAVFYRDGPNYHQEYLTLIRNAKYSIHLQTYIFAMDSFGALVHRELIIAAQKGVKVYLLIDSVGSRLFNHHDEILLVNSGINFVRFNQMQIKWLYSWGRRLHHKILLIDDQSCFVGGMNVLNSADKNSINPQLDFAVLLQGPIITKLKEYCQKIFKKNFPKKIYFEPGKPSLSFSPGVKLKILINDWVYRRWQITRLYSNLAKKAKNEITIIHSYFFPRKTFIKQLVAASKRGVHVRLILPKYSDWPKYILASEFLYGYLLKNGVEIYLWNKSIHHGKLATIDDHWSTIGSFNLDYTSYQQNIEMNINIYSKKFTHTVKKDIANIIMNDCEKLNIESFIKNGSLKKKSIRFFYYLILSTIANFSIGFIYQENFNKENKFNTLLRLFGFLLFFTLAVAGVFLPIIPSLPFLIISFLLIYKQNIYNKKKEEF